MRCFWLLLVLVVGLVLRGAATPSEDTNSRGAGDGSPKDAAKQETQEAKVIHGMCYVARCVKGHWDVRWKSGCRTSLIHPHRLHPPRGTCNHHGS
ncbi:Hypothetical predicted protein [Podarcis lilfordi]|uniref:Uncharacterized protein n=1 Tax=Podarcis lilfordi TaxID=74358 RepID=A0AA35L3M2_9SAUR|nr:Hypothetical predicted protein [Podarcis lilfordi]